MKTMEETLAEGLVFQQQGQAEKAVEIYSNILEVEPENDEALHLLGVSALQLGQIDQAIELIERALCFRPDTASYYNNLAAAYHHKTLLDKSEECYLKAIEINPQFADAYNNLGNLYREKKELLKSKQQYYKALSINPDHPAAFQSLKEVESELSGQSESTTNSNINDNLNNNSSSVELKQVLHVGCGGYNPKSLNSRYQNDQWKEIRLDIDVNVKPDIVASLTDMSAVESNTMDAVWSSHNVEHLYAHDVPIALAEFFRVLKPGGHALITVPDLQQVAEFIVEDRLDEVIYQSAKGPITGVDILFGHCESVAQGNHFMAHKTGFTATTLMKCLEKAGFVQLNSWFSPINLWVEGFKP